MMSKGPRRRFTTEFKEQAVARFSMPCATQAGVAQELGITSSQLKGWRLELEAAGSADAVRRQKAEAAELAELRRENRRPEGRSGGDAEGFGFFRAVGDDECEARLHRRPRNRARRPPHASESVGEPKLVHAWRAAAPERAARQAARDEMVAQGERIARKTVAKLMQRNDSGCRGGAGASRARPTVGTSSASPEPAGPQL